MSASLSMQPSMLHVLEVVFALPPDSAIHRAMEGNMYTTPEDFIMETDDIINDLDKMKRINPIHLGRLSATTSLMQGERG